MGPESIVVGVAIAFAIHTLSMWLAATIITDESRLSPALLAGMFPFAFSLVDSGVAGFLSQWIPAGVVTNIVLVMWLLIGAVSVKSIYRSNLTTGFLVFILALFFQTAASLALDATGLLTLTDNLVTNDIQALLAAR